MKTKWDISKLHNWEDNPRSIKEKDFNRLKEQIKKLGEYKPLLVTKDGTVLGGNMRLRAYKELGKKKVWVSVVNPKTKEEMMEYALSDNDRAGFYDSDLLANIMPEYDIEWGEFAVDLKEPMTLDGLIEPEIEEDEVPEVSDEPAISKLGEVYQLGRHRLMCGDSTKIEDVEKLMNGKKADMVFTDPPYDFETQGGGVLKNSKQMNEVKANKVDKFDPSVLIPYAKTNIYFHNKSLIGEYLKLSESWNMAYDLAIYKKPGLPNWAGHLMTDIEYIAIIGELDPNKGYEMPMYSKVYEGKKDQDNKLSYSKPVELCSKFIKLYSDTSVLDLFGGSGSTLIACEQTNRTCFMMELDPKYCDVIRKRYDNFIAKQQKNNE